MDFGPNLLHLLVAAGLSGLIGFEREFNKRDAGLRTHIMVGMGAALFTIVGAELGVDRTRMAAQVVSGIGFIGAGTIFRAGDSIKGLTTAAGMWTVAGIGVAAGFGMLALATTATVVALIVLFGLLPVVERLGAKNDRGNTRSDDAD
ncbi:MAG TPA: MgtC/SapB family protein [Acidimicrobiia bacterium]|nr:MgtC/SapB family protein [Acidimicrobiia bacterium]